MSKVPVGNGLRHPQVLVFRFEVDFRVDLSAKLQLQVARSHSEGGFAVTSPPQFHGTAARSKSPLGNR